MTQARGVTKPGTNAGSFRPDIHDEPATGIQSDWRDQTVMVEGRQFTLGDVHGGRMFHGSKHEIAAGDLLQPGKAEVNFAESDLNAVSITSEADKALGWARDTVTDGEPLYVYEVEPVGPVKVWRARLANYGQNWAMDEGRVPEARIVRRIDLEDAQRYQSALRNGEDPFPNT